MATARLVHNEPVTRCLPAIVLLLAATAAGCATAHARTAAAGPALEAPAPPPHELRVPADTDPASPPDTAAARPARPAPRPAPAKAPKPDPATAPVALPAVPPPTQPAATETPAPPPLQTSTNVAEVEKRVRALLGQAVRDLDHINVRTLRTERKAEYDTARRFVRQAEDALKVENVLFAEQLATKAATLAAGLLQRD